ncbi:MAG: hypothetical protein IJZ23_09300 [Roseburia sp.]|nr:hypothetical protein [Roseburia sp.]
MSISLDASMLNISSTATNNYNADKVKNSLNNVSSKTSEDELLEVCKDFESYFIEEIIKEVKENMTLEDEEGDSSLSTLTDFHMDSAIELISDQVLDQSGMSFTQQLYEQMKRNYGLE